MEIKSLMSICNAGNKQQELLIIIILSVYSKNITETKEDTEKKIADITKAVWEYFYILEIQNKN